MRRYLRDSGRLQGSAHRQIHPYEKARKVLEQRLGREPTEGEISEHLGLTPKDINDIEKALAIQQASSLDISIDEEGLTTLEDTVPDGSDQYVEFELRESLQQAVDSLDERSRTVLRLYYLRGLNQCEIGEKIGCCQMRVSKLLHKAEDKLRQRLGGVNLS